MELPLIGTQLQNQSRCGACRRRLPLERCDSSAEPALVFRTIKATRLSVANYNTTLSSESLETGTGGSNSLRSATESRLYHYRALDGFNHHARDAGLPSCHELQVTMGSYSKVLFAGVGRVQSAQGST